MIEVKNLVKKYGNHVAVDHLSFTVEKGQILGFLGPNGAGKSTTMNMITGYISATEGTVCINGYDIYEEPEEAKKCIGYLPELPPVYPDMTVREYLKFVADIKKVEKSKKKQMLQDIMERIQIADVADRLIKHLSKGYKQRVGLAQALVGYPEVIILDEPTVGLDPMQIIEIRDLIKELAREHTVILSSHILSEVSAVCDSVMIINKGKLIVRDEPDQLSKHLKRTGELDLEIKGKKEVIEEALKDITNIDSIQYKEETKEGLLPVHILTAGEDDVREEVFYALAKAECPIYSMKGSSMSLEDVFLELTKSEKSSEKLSELSYEKTSENEEDDTKSNLNNIDNEEETKDDSDL